MAQPEDDSAKRLSVKETFGFDALQTLNEDVCFAEDLRGVL